ncbi:MAG: hypothetical protein GDA38_10845 [Hormoscilla sp. SP12CHS1]|nr:hypothetical protein [Hormoscilla sp. SP12CHS1]
MTRELLTVCQATEEMSHPEGKEPCHDLELPASAAGKTNKWLASEKC